MKLDIRHIAPYLPYGLNPLKFKIQNGSIRTLDGMDKGWNVFGRTGMLVDKYHVETIKPILRPLSDLVKDGLFIKVLEPLFVGFSPNNNRKTWKFNFWDDGINLEITNPYNVYSFVIDLNNADVLIYRDEELVPHIDMYKYYQLLFENHFDIFGLIKAGIARDINTINP